MLRKFILKSTEITHIDSLLSEPKLAQEIFWVGVNKELTAHRTLCKFDLITQLPPGCYIEKAELKLFCMKNDNMKIDALFEVYPLKEYWGSNTVDWNNQPLFDQNKNSAVTIGYHYWEHVTLDITALVKYWQDEPEKNFGLVIKSSEEKALNSLVGFNTARLEIIGSIDKVHATQTKSKVAILTPRFFEDNGGICLFGGRERYLVDLINLMYKLGYQVDVFQASSGETWERNYNGITIRGIASAGREQDFYVKLNEEFYHQASDADYHIYFGIDVAYPYIFPNSICINQGIWWDTEEKIWWRSDTWYEKIFLSLNNIGILVSGDTNTLKWINAVKPEIACQRIYLPNYADLSIFRYARKKTHKRRYSRRLKPVLHKQYINILYPRQLETSHGWSLCKEIAVELVKEYKNIKFCFVGRGSEEAEKHMDILSSKFPRIEYKWYEMDDMYKAYQDADIVLIPSLSSAGGTQALLEAMAAGKAIIASRVGGITDIIINGYNGYLIEPNKENLKFAILELIENYRLRRYLGHNAKEVSLQFSKEIWEARWSDLLNEYFPL